MKKTIILLCLAFISCNSNYFKQNKNEIALIDNIYSASVNTIKYHAFLLFDSKIKFYVGKDIQENYDVIRYYYSDYSDYLEKLKNSLLNNNSNVSQEDKDEILKKRESFYQLMLRKTPYKSLLLCKFEKFMVFKNGFAFSDDDFMNYLLIYGLLFESANYFYNYVTLLVPKGE